MVLASLSMKPHRTKKGGEGVMQVTAGTYRMWANELQENMIHRDVIEHKVWIVTAAFHVMPYMNEARYFPRDTTFNTVRLVKP